MYRKEGQSKNNPNANDVSPNWSRCSKPYFPSSLPHLSLLALHNHDSTLGPLLADSYDSKNDNERDAPATRH